MDDVQFNNELMQLLADVGIAYEQSDIKKVNLNWSYSLISPMPTQGCPLLIGINWGEEITQMNSFMHRQSLDMTIYRHRI
ncbi:hypothetical protein SPWS13_1971 [Shewanella putrefaciens]|nr:hypothetical protein SPWS13_1971 [Shewanella putrefaciens]